MGGPREEDLRLAREVKKRLADKVRILDFRLFGSRARGTSTWDSDMDLYIEVDALSKDQEALINDVAFELSLDGGVVIVPMVFTKDEVEASPLRVSPFFKAIQREGISL